MPYFQVLNPLLDRALQLYPEEVGNFLRTGKTKDEKRVLSVNIDGRKFNLVVKLNERKRTWKDIFKIRIYLLKRKLQLLAA